jgi:hypothetical protein
MKDETVRSGNTASGDFDLDSFLKENNFLTDEDDKNIKKDSRASSSIARGSGVNNAQKTQSKPNADPNATVSYQAADLDYPEFPFVEDHDSGGTRDRAGGRKKAAATKNAVVAEAKVAAGVGSQAAANGSAQAADKLKNPSTKKTVDAAAPAVKAKAGTGASSSSPSSKSKTGSMTARKTGSMTKVAAARKKGHPSAKGNAKTAQGGPRLQTIANPKDFHRAEIDDSSYHIRGGGTRHNKRTPALVIVIAAVIIVAVVLFGALLINMYTTMVDKSTVKPVVTLTAAETRAAIDAQMPRVVDHTKSNATDVYNAFIANGWSVYLNSRATEDDPNNAGGEIIRLDPAVPADVLNGYYSGEFNSYDFDELQKSFNGSWFLDISHGGQGALAQLKYINFAAEATANEADPLKAELLHLKSLQGLEGEGVVVLNEGVDDFGNTFIQGTITVGDTKYYWKLVGIALNEYYGGKDKRELPATAVFVRCSVSDFNFYGAVEPEENAGAGSEGEPPASGESDGAGGAAA